MYNIVALMKLGKSIFHTPFIVGNGNITRLEKNSMDDSLAQSKKNFRSQEWVREYFVTVDKLNVDNIIANFVENGQFRFGNAEPVVGKEAIRDALVKFFSAIKAMHHENVGLWLGDSSAVFEAEVTYTRQDGTTVTLPCVSILRFRDNFIYDFRMVMDAAPVFAA
ncbi:MAG: hypothetical protein N4J56_006600 [Chroococcidiopsis sp. SAG 2025]|uniref:nuclear transport factor 2 family protein n=1 Tax=Chroococcidiopsis sp. SAG 2025 TaxID=171389 RepID=UPI002936EB2E|nr:nuclear transport factor 2 family protein [Chroococcidiopsis sp. SAG 2025]MDV2996895.1 hypothetical protein [Chroococcidiopsis sp. SAG 2025]